MATNQKDYQEKVDKLFKKYRQELQNIISERDKKLIVILKRIEKRQIDKLQNQINNK